MPKDYAGALEVIEEVLKVDDSRNYLNRLAAYSCYDKKPQELEKGQDYIGGFFNKATEEQIIHQGLCLLWTYSYTSWPKMIP